MNDGETSTASYRAWYRLPGQQWQSVVTAPSEDQAWHQLRQRVEELGAKFVDTYVGAAGIDPNAGSAMRRRRF